MGELLSALQSAGAEVNKAGNSLLGPSGGGTPSPNYDPGVSLTPAGQMLPSVPGQMATDMGPQAAETSGGNYVQAAPVNMAAAGAPPPVAPEAEEEPFDNKYTPFDDEQKPVVVTGDDWKPKSPGWLGEILDVFALMRGDAPAFKIRRNMPEVLESLKQDPDQAIRRMQQVHGPTAWKMYEDLSQIKEAQARAELARERERELGFNRLSALLGPVKNMEDPEQAKALYTKGLPLYRRYAESKGWSFDEAQEMFPDEYDPDRVDMIYQGGMSVYQKEQNRISEQRLAETIRRNTVLDSQGERRVQATERNTESLIETRERTADSTIEKNTTSSQLAKQKSGKYYPDGRPVQRILDRETKEPVGSFSPDGTVVKVIMGGEIGYFRVAKPFTTEGMEFIKKVPIPKKGK